MRIRSVALSVAALLLPIAGPAIVAAQQRAPAPAAGTLFLTPERVPLPDGGLGEAERGILFVPVNRARPGSGVVGVEIWRFRAQRASGAPPLFVLNGGPGFPGLDGALARPEFWEKYVRQFTEVTDFVVIGQRGIGSSRPDTKCANGPAYQSAVRCREYWTGKGLDLAGFTVVEAAADVKDAAAALGYDRIVVYGGSFGSHWGMAVMRYHPELVARAVLTGMEGPNHTYDSASGILNSLRRVAAAAELNPRIRALAPAGGIIGGLEATRSRLAEKPVQVVVVDTSGTERKTAFAAGHVAALSTGYSGSVGSRTEIATWPADMLRLYYGDFETAARARANRSTGGAANYRTASYYMLDCGSGITAERLATLRADPARLLVGDRAAFYQAVCQAWDADLGDEFRANFDTAIPTVIVHGNWDVSTPYENALELAPHFTRGKLVTVVGGTHGALNEALEADSAFARSLWDFVRTGDRSRMPDSVVLPPIDWSVPADLEAMARRVMGPGGGAPR